MATFGPIASAAPNVLFSPMAVDAAVQGRQRNQLMMDTTRQDQQQQTFQRDAAARIGMARELSNLPEAQAAAEWGTYRQRLQASGLGQGLPEQFPGMERLRAVASSDLTTFQRMQLEEKKRSSDAFLGALAPGAPTATPVSAPAGVPVAGGNTLAPDTFALQRQQESSGDPNARNPRSSATGADQFIDGTWREYAAAHPDRFQGLTDQQILARRTDPEESGRAAQWYARENARTLAANGLPNGPGEVTLAHRFGPAGAAAALRADPNAPAAQVFGEQVMRANPDLAGKTVGQVVQQYQQRYGGTGGVAARTGGTDMAGAGVPAPAAGPAVQANGLTAQQEQQVRGLAAGGDVSGARQMLMTFQNQNRQDTRQEARDARQERLDAERAAAAGVPAGYRRKADGGLEPIPGGPADKPAESSATEAERKAGSYLERMQGAEDLLQGMVRDGYNPGNIQDRAAGATPIIGNFFTTERGQQYLNAAAEWARAKLRLESGAVIGEEEAKAEARTYFPMPGDSAATIAQKQTLRDNATSAIRRQAGRSAPPAPAARDDGNQPAMSSRDALTAARAKLGDGASDDDVVAEAVRLRGGR